MFVALDVGFPVKDTRKKAPGRSERVLMYLSPVNSAYLRWLLPDSKGLC